MDNPAARQRALDVMKAAQENWDTEAAHGDADQGLCDLLMDLGYADVVAEYGKVEKWFA